MKKIAIRFEFSIADVFLDAVPVLDFPKPHKKKNNRVNATVGRFIAFPRSSICIIQTLELNFPSSFKKGKGLVVKSFNNEILHFPLGSTFSSS